MDQSNRIDTRNMRYIVMLIDSKSKEHDGMVKASYQEAKEYVQDVINDGYADKAVIGMFLLDANARDMFISKVETIGFAGDKKKVNQLQLFQELKK